jgi:hypothetical protein
MKYLFSTIISIAALKLRTNTNSALFSAMVPSMASLASSGMYP